MDTDSSQSDVLNRPELKESTRSDLTAHLVSFRTLEFLMRHLVKMASYSSETNMHARNLAIVWAPNLLRFASI